jgi:hypothetical protein
MKIRLRRGRLFRPAGAAGLGVALAGLCLALAGCAGFQTYRLESRPLAPLITVDGQADDWRGNLYFNAEGQYSLGFMNDDQDLYVCLVVNDPYKRSRILRAGLMLWLDPRGGKDKSLGIEFPLGMTIGRSGAPGETRNLPLPPDEEEAAAYPSDSWTELEITRPKSEMPLKMKVEEAKGLVVKASAPAGLFVYELKIPLLRTDETPWAVGARPGQTIGLGFEPGRVEMRRMSQGPGGRRGGMMGGRRPDYYGGAEEPGGFGRGIVIPEDLRVWTLVKLR